MVVKENVGMSLPQAQHRLPFPEVRIAEERMGRNSGLRPGAAGVRWIAPEIPRGGGWEEKVRGGCEVSFGNNPPFHPITAEAVTTNRCERMRFGVRGELFVVRPSGLRGWAEDGMRKSGADAKFLSETIHLFIR